MSEMRAIDLDNDDEEPRQSTEEHGRGKTFRQGFNKAFVYSAPGALKIIEILLSLVGFVATLAGYFQGVGYVMWVTISAFITITLWFLMEVLYLWDRLPCVLPVVVELFYHALYTLQYFVAAIISGIKVPYGAGIVMTCVLCVTAFLIFLLDTIISYQKLQSSREERTQPDNINIPED